MILQHPGQRQQGNRQEWAQIENPPVHYPVCGLVDEARRGSQIFEKPAVIVIKNSQCLVAVYRFRPKRLKSEKWHTRIQPTVNLVVQAESTSCDPVILEAGHNSEHSKD